MNRYYYDLHLHSCLSPCADNDNTPNNLAGMASLCGLNVIALTDHNSSKNCPAFFSACKQYGIIPIAGMELTTAEDIHVICLFPTLESAMEFDKYIETRRMPIKNRTDIFGDQLITDSEDNVIGQEENLLITATTVSLDEAPGLVKQFGGICYPAHIDRQANGVIEVLGTFPKTPYFSVVELNRKEAIEEYREKYSLQDKKIVVSSDAHRLDSMRDKENYFDIDDEPYSSALVRKNLIELLR